MTTYAIKSEHVDIPRATVETLRYEDGTLAVRVWDGLAAETLSVNLSAQGAPHPGEGEFYCKDYSEFIGVPDALEASGLAVKLGPIEVGPLKSPAWLMRLVGETR